VRFVQVTHSYKWDQHDALRRDHESNAKEVDQPIAALIKDLKARGMLKDTMLIAIGEFGRSPRMGVSTSGNGKSTMFYQIAEALGVKDRCALVP
jgi:uncharacterized protein (DUF1501 family)